MTTRKLLAGASCAAALTALGFSLLFPVFAHAKMGDHRHDHHRTVPTNGLTFPSPPPPKPVVSVWSPIRSVNLKGFIPKTGIPVLDIYGKTANVRPLR